MESKIFIQPQPKYDVVVSNTSDIPNLIITKAKEKMVVTIAAAMAGKGREILFQVNETHIQWQYAGEETWTNLIAIADLKGDTPTSFPAAGVVEDEGHVFLTANQKSDLLSFKENFVHNQLLAADTWNITHNLGKYPSVTVVDSAGTVVIGEIKYTDLNSIRIMFAAEFSGKVYFN